MSKQYRELTETEKGWAQNLKAIYEAKKSFEGLSQQTLGDRLGMSQSAVGQYLNAKIPLNISSIIAFSRELKCDLNAINPELESLSSLSQDELQLISLYRQKNQKGKELVLGVAESAPEHRNQD